MPEMMAPPKPLQSGLDKLIGSSPNTVQSLVKMIGSNLEAPASAMASLKGIFCFRFRFILSTINIEFVTTIPNKANTPIRAGKDRGVPVSANTANTDETAKGMTISTIVACR